MWIYERNQHGQPMDPILHELGLRCTACGSLAEVAMWD